MMKDYPVGAAQKMVLDALNMTATGFSDANRKFDEIGIVVTSKRQGHTSIPVVEVRDQFGGGWEEGSGVEYKKYQALDTTPIDQWIEK